MNYILAVFRSRFATLNFANLLRANNIPVAIINTPSQIGTACSICVKFFSDYFAKVQAVAEKHTAYANFVGFFPLSPNGYTKLQMRRQR